VKTAVVGCVVLLLTLGVGAQERRITPEEAENHLGETVTVCGKVAGTRYAERRKGQPTFLNFEKPYPSLPFRVVIFGSDRPKFGEPEKTYLHKRVCVTGKIREYRGGPAIVASDSKQLYLEGAR
jgi:hypothetical protein